MMSLVRKQLRYLSIRARVAFCILCLYEYLERSEFDIKDWSFILDKLWSFCPSEDIEKWFEMMAEYIPHSIYKNPFEKGDFITVEQYNLLQKLYSKSNDINYIIDRIFDIVSMELYGKVVPDGPSLSCSMDIASKLQDKNVALPPLYCLLKYRIEIRHGWGERFSKNDIIS